MGTRTRGFANFIGTDGKLQQGSLAAGVGGIAFQAVKTADFNAVAGEGYFVNTTSGAITVTLPSGTPTAGAQIQLVDYAGTFDTNALTINPNGNKIEGATANLQLSGEREGVLLVFTDATQGWLATSGIQEGTDGLEPISYSVDFLVIAGGGGGGGSTGTQQAGGGGAGGYRNSFSTETSGGNESSEASLTFIGETVYTITVGGGGAGGITDTNAAVNGVNSSISGTNITTITSTGGGKGGTGNNSGSNGNGASGGSGGGGGGRDGGTTTGGSGTANQGFGGANGSINNIGGSGGGAGGAGNTSSSYTATVDGGIGLASSITGSSVTRGVGGRAIANTINSSNATSNTGNGGDGETGSGVNGYNGGSGVVILSMPLVNFSGTTTGSPTESDDGTTKRLIFNDSGTYTG